MRKFGYIVAILTFSFMAPLVGKTQYKPVSAALSARPIDVTNASESVIRNYYANLNSLNATERQGDNLLKNLKPILKNGHASFNYATVWDWTKITDRDWNLSSMTPAELSNYAFNDNPYVKLLYRSDNGTSTAAQHGDAHGQVIDREHVWPKSLGNFGENAPAGTDLHHLILADSKNNQSGHNQYAYGNVNPEDYTPIDSYDNPDNPTNVNVFTGKRGTITYNGQTATVYEPQTFDKGDIARAMFYMAARYSSYTSQSDPYLKLSNSLNSIVSTTSTTTIPGQGGLLDVLLTWHTIDPVDDYEIKRNNLIYHNAQFNRNPFIDYPSWVDSVWGSKVAANPALDDVALFGEQGSVTPTALALSPTILSLGVSDTSNLTLGVTPISASKSVTWSSSNEQVATVTNGTVTALAIGTTTITATSTLDANVKATMTLSVVAQHLKKLEGISLSGIAGIVKYGDLYPHQNIVVTATYDDASTANVTASSTVPGPNTTKLGDQSLVVTYTEGGVTKFASYNVKVTNNGVVVGDVVRVATDLFISEYIEGSSNNKAIEIYNGTGSSIMMSAYQIVVYSNGSATPSNTITLSGTLLNNQTYKVVHSSASSTLLTLADLQSGSLLHNGNDAVALHKNGVPIDIMGTIGSADIFAENVTLVRKSAIFSPTTTFNALEWTTYAQDTFTYLGSHDYNATMPGLTAETQATAWADYFLEVTGVYCEMEAGETLAGSIWTTLGLEYGYMDASSKTLFANTTADPDGVGIAGAKARYHFLITKYSLLDSNNFMTNGSNQAIYSLLSNRSTSATHVNDLLLLGVFGSIALLGFVSYKKRKVFN